MIMPRQSFGNGRICVDVGLTSHAGNQEVVETAVYVPVTYGTLCVSAWSSER